MKNATTYLFLLILFLFQYCQVPPTLPTASELPLPTNGETEKADYHEEGAGKGDARRAWNALKHKAAPGTDWQAIERSNASKAYLTRQKLLRTGQPKSAVETLANGNLTGEWLERGSNNQAGSLREMDYDATNEQIYGVSDGGTVWRGNLDGTSWTALNEDFQFHPHILNIIPNGNGTNRIIASLGKVIHYSDDEGQTWMPSTGFNFYDGWGSPKRMYALNDNQSLYYLVQTWNNSPWGAAVWLFYSNNKGASFQRIAAYQQIEDRRIDIWSPYDSDKAYLIANGSDLYELNGATVNLLNSNTDIPTTSNISFGGSVNGSTTTFYALIDDTNVYRSTNNGANWTMLGSTPVNAWFVGLHVSPFNSNRLYIGAVDCYRSYDSGANWTMVNSWGEYYGNLDKLHADIMDLKSFKKTDGTEFTLIANHGGIHVSYDDLLTTTNIGRAGLNISQYYDVRTQPNDVTFFYAGSQDQGHQRAATAVNEDIADFEQVISGDYGQMAFSKNGENFWTVYPGGDVSYYENPQTEGQNATYSLGGTHRPVVGWINPTSEHIDPSLNKIYIAGGNINGGDGSYLVELTATENAPYQITANQINYDFRANSNDATSTISAIETSDIDTDRIYVATSDGTFFYSSNAGSTWSKTSNFSGPSESWITPTSIYASKLTSNLLWFGGSGYSNPGVYKSTNGGQTFAPMSNGLPSTVVNELVANDEETMLFAATDAGPYVYVVAENTWYNILGMYAPLQTYQSVEYIAGLDVIRFGTYGRGIWDFKLSCTRSTFYADKDGDGYGDPNVMIQACSAPVSYVANNLDCEDRDANAYPGTSNAEICDGLDNNCDGQIDEGFAVSCGSYCEPSHFGGINDYITKVQISAIDNSSSSYTSTINGYSDFSTVATDVLAGETYPLTITPNYSWPESRLGVWIDWNKDLVFQANERVAALTGQGPWSMDVLVPNDAFVGPVRMRIRQQYGPNYDPNPCDAAYSSGETEDYTLNVLSNANACDDVHLAIDDIPVAAKTYKAEQTITSTGTIAENTTVIYQAGTSITLDENFHAEDGSSFRAIIQDCGLAIPIEKEQAIENRSINASPLVWRIFPNPMSDQAHLQFELTEQQNVQIDLFDSNGRRVQELKANAHLAASQHQIPLNVAHLESGIYFVRMQVGQQKQVKQIVVQ
ncbi:MAG: 3-coathanger stack domain-containing protein [Bacteroidota bacterium]